MTEDRTRDFPPLGSSALLAAFVEITEDFDRRDGGERWIRRIDPMCWISVLYRLPGFGWHEWETALVFVHDVPTPTWKDRDVLIIGGDRREELATMPKEQLREWYAANIDGHRNSVETILEAMKSSS